MIYLNVHGRCLFPMGRPAAVVSPTMERRDAPRRLRPSASGNSNPSPAKKSICFVKSPTTGYVSSPKPANTQTPPTKIVPILKRSPQTSTSPKIPLIHRSSFDEKYPTDGHKISPKIRVLAQKPEPVVLENNSWSKDDLRLVAIASIIFLVLLVCCIFI